MVSDGILKVKGRLLFLFQAISVQGPAQENGEIRHFLIIGRMKVVPQVIEKIMERSLSIITVMP